MGESFALANYRYIAIFNMLSRLFDLTCRLYIYGKIFPLRAKYYCIALNIESYIKGSRVEMLAFSAQGNYILHCSCIALNIEWYIKEKPRQLQNYLRLI